MGEPKAITYKEVERATGGDKIPTVELWHKIGDITGAGHVGLDVDGNATIDITNVTDAKRERIEKLLADAESEKAEAKAEAKDEAAPEAAERSTKRGK